MDFNKSTFKETFTVESFSYNTIKVSRAYLFQSYDGRIKLGARVGKSKNSKGDTYDRKIGMIVAILKTLGYSNSRCATTRLI